MSPWKKIVLIAVFFILPIFIILPAASASVTDEAIYSKGSVITEYNAVFDIPGGASDYTRVKLERYDFDRIKAPGGSSVTGFIYRFTKTNPADFLKPITVTLPYKKYAFDPEKQIISIYWYDEQLKLWIELDNVIIDEEAMTVSGQTVKTGYFAIIASDKIIGKPEQPVAEPEPEIQEPEVVEPVKTSYPDIEKHWAKTSIVPLLEMGAMTGYDDNTFRPAQAITRAEFTAAIVKAFHLRAETGYVFGDTADHWAKNEISVAVANKIVAGYNDRQFGPDDTITREQMAAILVKAARLNETTGDLTFSDKEDISPWARGLVITAVNNDLLSGYFDNTFKPQGQASRSEAATVIFKAIENIKPVMYL